MVIISSKKIFWFISTLLLITFLSTRIFSFKRGLLENVATAITYPAILISSNVAEYLQNRQNKKEDYQLLKQKYEKLNNGYEELIAENVRLHATLHFDKQSHELVEFQTRYNLTDKILAKILVKNINPDEHYFLINKGLQNGIKKDMVAIYMTQIVGRISDVFEHYSKLVLITDPNCKIAAYASGTGANGIVLGQNNISLCKFSYVSHLTQIAENDVIISSAQGLIFPEGFCLGKIVKHSIEQKSLYHDIEIKPFFDLKDLQFCLLVDNSKINLALEHTFTATTKTLNDSHFSTKTQSSTSSPETPIIT